MQLALLHRVLSRNKSRERSTSMEVLVSKCVEKGFSTSEVHSCIEEMFEQNLPYDDLKAVLKRLGYDDGESDEEANRAEEPQSQSQSQSQSQPEDKPVPVKAIQPELEPVAPLVQVPEPEPELELETKPEPEALGEPKEEQIDVSSMTFEERMEKSFELQGSTPQLSGCHHSILQVAIIEIDCFGASALYSFQ